jgi:hypothetical protein
MDIEPAPRDGTSGEVGSARRPGVELERLSGWTADVRRRHGPECMPVDGRRRSYAPIRHRHMHPLPSRSPLYEYTVVYHHHLATQQSRLVACTLSYHHGVAFAHSQRYHPEGSRHVMSTYVSINYPQSTASGTLCYPCVCMHVSIRSTTTKDALLILFPRWTNHVRHRTPVVAPSQLRFNASPTSSSFLVRLPDRVPR